MTKTWLNLSIVVGLVFMLAVSGCTDYKAGKDAYHRSDYETALNEFRPLAEQGDVAAQFILGVMYDEGKGVPQDYTEAGKWYRSAADQGHTATQYILGVMYAVGRGVPQNYIQAYMWNSLAAAEGFEIAITDQYVLESLMTPEQLAEAQRLAREWKPKGMQ